MGALLRNDKLFVGLVLGLGWVFEDGGGGLKVHNFLCYFFRHGEMVRFRSVEWWWSMISQEALPLWEVLCFVANPTTAPD